jgi:hypothetical protein
MNIAYQQYIPADFHDTSRVWIYQSSRMFGMSEALQLEDIFQQFTDNWNSHGAKVKGYANLFFGQFIVIMADETQAGVSGCSTDSSVRMIREIESQFGVNLFDRQSLAFVIRDRVQLLPMQQLSYAYENHFIDDHTLYFNNLVNTKEALLQHWIIPIKDSWLAKRLPVEENK